MSQCYDKQRIENIERRQFDEGWTEAHPLQTMHSIRDKSPEFSYYTADELSQNRRFVEEDLHYE